MIRILVVEDEEAIRSFLRLALEAAGYEVVEAANGQEGLAMYHQTAIGLVITDLEMPEMDGATMIEALRDAQAQIPVIVISGQAGAVPQHASVRSAVHISEAVLSECTA